MTETWDVIVVGAGLAGLTAAATAAQMGRSVVVLESRQPGGRARTVDKDGFTFNMGVHALYVAGEGNQILRGLGIHPKGAAPPHDRYRLAVDGELHVMPTSPGSLLRTKALGTRSKAKLARLLAAVPKIDPSEFAGLSAAGWVTDLDLRPDADRYLRAMLRLGTYARDLDDLSAEGALLQLKRSVAEGVLYLDGGWSQLTDALKAKVDVRTGSAVRSVASDGTSATVETGEGSYTARTVVVAVGTPAAARNLVPSSESWGELGDPVVVACLDVGTTREPSPGFVLSLDAPVYVTVQSPPARQAPKGSAVVSAVRYGTRSADEDRDELERSLAIAGVKADDVAVKQFLAKMTVTGAQPRAVNGGLFGRPPTTATGARNVLIAGDWVGPEGMLSDAAVASGHAAGRLAADQASQGAVR